MNLEDLGFNNIKNTVNKLTHLSGFELGRVLAEHKERYLVATAKGEIDAEITGNMRFSANGREDFPAVGDWVALLFYDDDFAIINEILPRYSVIKRKAVGSFGDVQLIAANIDYAFIMQSANRDFNLNRIERYLTICYASKVKPVILLTKTDLISEEELKMLTKQITERVENVPFIAISNETESGYDELKQILEGGETYCMLGSSGVGKSTLLNNLLGNNMMKTDAISVHSDRGKHVSTHRELTLLDNGAILIDNPGMREVGMVDNSNGLDITYDKIAEFAQNCRYYDCTHTNETGCAVIAAVDNGEIERSYYHNYLKLKRESAHFESTVQEKRKKDKDFGKMVRNIKKHQKRNKIK